MLGRHLLERAEVLLETVTACIGLARGPTVRIVQAHTPVQDDLAIHARRKRRDALRLVPVIGVEDADPVAAGPGDALVEGIRDPSVGLAGVGDEARRAVYAALQDGEGAIRRAPVNDHVLDHQRPQRQHRVETTLDRRRPIQHRRDDGDPRHRAALSALLKESPTARAAVAGHACERAGLHVDHRLAIAAIPGLGQDTVQQPGRANMTGRWSPSHVPSHVPSHAGASLHDCRDTGARATHGAAAEQV
jgi:hypothetical protein